MLAGWSVEVSRFRKVMPTDYKRVLAVIRLRPRRQGLDEAETVARSHGGGERVRS